MTASQCICGETPTYNSYGHNGVTLGWEVYCRCGLIRSSKESEADAVEQWNALMLGNRIAKHLLSGKISPEAQQVIRDHFWEIL